MLWPKEGKNNSFYVILGLNMFLKLHVIQMVLITSQLERKRALGLPLESQALKPSVSDTQEKKVYIYLNSISKHKVDFTLWRI